MQISTTAIWASGCSSLRPLLPPPHLPAAFPHAVPLQQRYGALPVLLRSLAIAALLTLPLGVVDRPVAEVSATSTIALLALGAFGTGLAFVAMTTLLGRAGATRGSIATYFIPIVALALGVLFRSEPAPLLAIVGIGMILVGAWLTSRREED